MVLSMYILPSGFSLRRAWTTFHERLGQVWQEVYTPRWPVKRCWSGLLLESIWRYTSSLEFSTVGNNIGMSVKIVSAGGTLGLILSTALCERKDDAYSWQLIIEVVDRLSGACRALLVSTSLGVEERFHPGSTSSQVRYDWYTAL